MKNDLIYMKRVYDMKPYFMEEISKQIQDIGGTWTFPGIVDVLQCIDMNNRNIENYLFMKYGELFITEILMSKNDYKKETNKETDVEKVGHNMESSC